MIDKGTAVDMPRKNQAFIGADVCCQGYELVKPKAAGSLFDGSPL